MNSEIKPSALEVGKCYKLIHPNSWTTYSNDKCLYRDRSDIFIKKNDAILILSQFKKTHDSARTFISFFYKGDLLYTFLHWNEFDKFEEIQ